MADPLIGGQAVIEGVMMKGPKNYAVALRLADGSIKTKSEPFVSFTTRNKLFGLPVIRGIVVFIEMMVLGIKVLTYSANEQIDEEEEAEKRKEAEARTEPEKKGDRGNFKHKKKKEQKKEELGTFALVSTLVIAFAFALFVFKFIPLWLTKLMVSFNIIGENRIIFNLIDGLIRITFFIIYVVLISLMKDVKRVFQYHGAEHKAVSCLENRLPLTVENVKKFSTKHPRCGTSFIFIVLIMFILVFSLVPIDLPTYLIFLIRLPLLLPIAGLSYEVLRVAGRYKDSALFKAISYPGMLIQNLTTKEPADDMVEVSIASLKLLLEKENIKTL